MTYSLCATCPGQYLLITSLKVHTQDWQTEGQSSSVCLFLQYWLDLDKQMNHQVGLPSRDPFLRFCVKFYPPDPPSQIEEEYTRYLFGLQIKRDLASGALQCNDNTAALMASYIVQGGGLMIDCWDAN